MEYQKLVSSLKWERVDGDDGETYCKTSLRVFADRYYPLPSIIKLCEGLGSQPTKAQSKQTKPSPNDFMLIFGDSHGLSLFCKENSTNAKTLFSDEFYKKAFFASSTSREARKLQQMDWDDIDGMFTTESGHHHCFVVICLKENQGSRVQVVSGLSYLPSQEGTMISWLATTRDVFEINKYTIEGDGQSFRKRGLATLLVAFLLEVHRLKGIEGNIFTQLNPNIDSAVRFWRCHLLFKRWNDKETTPDWLEEIIIEGGGLILIYAEYTSLDNIFPAVISQDSAHLKRIIQVSKQALFDYNFPIQRKNCIEELFSPDVREILVKANRPVALPAESLEDENKYENDNKRYFADENILQKCYVINDKEIARIVDAGQGDESKNEESCFYVCVSYLLFGDISHYIEIKVLVSHIFYILSRLPSDHELLKNPIFLYGITILGEELFPDKYKDKTEADRETVEHGLQVLADLASDVMEPDHWGCDVEINILCSAFGINVCCLSATSDIAGGIVEHTLPDGKKEKRRQWNATCNSAFTPQPEMCDAPDDHVTYTYMIAQWSQKHFVLVSPPDNPFVIPVAAVTATSEKSVTTPVRRTTKNSSTTRQLPLFRSSIKKTDASPKGQRTPKITKPAAKRPPPTPRAAKKPPPAAKKPPPAAKKPLPRQPSKKTPPRKKPPVARQQSKATSNPNTSSPDTVLRDQQNAAPARKNVPPHIDATMDDVSTLNDATTVEEADMVEAEMKIPASSPGTSNVERISEHITPPMNPPVAREQSKATSSPTTSFQETVLRDLQHAAPPARKNVPPHIDAAIDDVSTVANATTVEEAQVIETEVDNSASLPDPSDVARMPEHMDDEDDYETDDGRNSRRRSSRATTKTLRYRPPIPKDNSNEKRKSVGTKSTGKRRPSDDAGFTKKDIPETAHPQGHDKDDTDDSTAFADLIKRMDILDISEERKNYFANLGNTIETFPVWQRSRNAALAQINQDHAREKQFYAQHMKEKQKATTDKRFVKKMEWEEEKTMKAEFDRVWGTPEAKLEAADLMQFDSLIAMRELSQREIQANLAARHWTYPPRFKVLYKRPADINNNAATAETKVTMEWARENLHPLFIQDVLLASQGRLESDYMDVDIPKDRVIFYNKQPMQITLVQLTGSRSKENNLEACVWKYSVINLDDPAARVLTRDITKDELEEFVREAKTKICLNLEVSLMEVLRTKNIGTLHTVSKNVRRHKLIFTEDKGQISQLRYVLEANSEEGYYKGKIFHHDTRKWSIVTLTTPWVQGNFPKPFLERVKAKHASARKCFVSVPVGSSRQINDGDFAMASLAVKRNIPNLYQQKDRDTCVTSSLANALFYMGCYNEAVQIEEFGRQFIERTGSSYQLIIHAQREIVRLFKKRYWDAFRLDNGCDILSLPTSFNLRLCEWMSTDSDTTHCVSIIGELVFDSNFPRALPLNRWTLDFCCGRGIRNGNTETKYANVHMGYEFRTRPFNRTTKRKCQNHRKKRKVDHSIKKEE